MLKIEMIGNIGKEPELRYTPGGKAVTDFPVASSNGKDKPATWITVTCWEDLAEEVVTNFSKGDRVFLTGNRLKARSYTNQAGDAGASLEMTADVVTPYVSAEDDELSRMSATVREERPVRPSEDLPF